MPIRRSGLAHIVILSILTAFMALASSGCATHAEGLTRPGDRGLGEGADFVIRNVHVIDTRSGEVFRDRAILIREKRIVGVLSANVALPRARSVDGRGAYAIPGLWDSHVHLLQDDAETARRIAPRFLARGVTHIRDMGSSVPALQATDSIEASGDAPVIHAAGPAFWAFELPYGDKAQQEIVRTNADTEAAVSRAAAAGADFIKVYAGFEPPRLGSLVEAAEAHGLRVAGHAQPGAPVDAQARMGLSTVEHLEFSTFTGCGPDPEVYFNRLIAARFRDSGETIPQIFVEFANAVDRPVCVAMLRRAAGAGLVMTPTLGASLLPPSLARGILPDLSAEQAEGCRMYLAPFSDQRREAEEAYLAAGRYLMGMVREAGLPLLAGTDAPVFCGRLGEGLALELRLLSEAGLSPLEALQSATLTPARAFGQSDRLGAIEPGLEAHILLLDGNPLTDMAAYDRPVGLLTQGRWRDETALSALRQVSAR